MCREAKVWIALLVALLGGCGGKVDAEEEGDGVPASTDGAAPEPDSEADTPTQPTMSGSTRLPPCTIGFDLSQHPERRCDWIHEGLCYETKLEACACACPRKRATTCVSGFEGPMTEVSCF